MKMIPETALDHLLLNIRRNYKTQAAAARAWGVSQGYLSAVVTGERPIPGKLLDLIGWEWRLVPKDCSCGIGLEPRRLTAADTKGLMQEIAASPEKAREFLKECGLLTQDGKRSPNFYPDDPDGVLGRKAA